MNNYIMRQYIPPPILTLIPFYKNPRSLKGQNKLDWWYPRPCLGFDEALLTVGLYLRNGIMGSERSRMMTRCGIDGAIPVILINRNIESTQTSTLVCSLCSLNFKITRPPCSFSVIWAMHLLSRAQ